MRKILYCTSRRSLLHPEGDPCMFTAAKAPSEDMLCAEASRLVYKQCEGDAAHRTEVEDAFRSIGFVEFEFFCQDSSQALGAWNPSSKTALVAFRGTQQDLKDFVTNLKTWRVAWRQGGTVHCGFAEAFDCLWSAVERWVDDHHPERLLMTGHSLGAALSTLAASLRKPARLVTFGSPRVGDLDFVGTLAEVPVTRYVDCCDVVCKMPPANLGFEHAGTVHYIDRLGQVRIDATEKFIRRDQAKARVSYILGHSWKIGTALTRGLADHTPLNYVYPL